MWKNTLLFAVLCFALLALLSVFIAISSANFISVPRPKAHAGILNLRAWNPERDGVVRLNGEWEFYWQQLLEPADFTVAANKPAPTGMIDLPRSWNGYPIGGQKLKGDGYATFRLRILTNLQKKPVALKIPSMFTAYRLWVDGNLIASAGVVDENRFGMTPQFIEQMAHFVPQTDATELVLQISNYHHLRGGINQPIYLGTQKQIVSYTEQKLAFEMFIIGSLIFMGLYHVGIFSLRTKDKVPLYFGLFCLTLGIRALFVGEIMLTKIFPHFNYELEMKIEYITLYFAVPIFAYYLHHLYPQEMSRFVSRISFFVAAIFGTITLLTPARTFTKMLTWYEIYTTSMMIHMAYAIFLAILRQREAARLIFAATLVFFSTVIIDFLYYSENSPIGNLFPFGLFVFTLAQAFLLSRRFANAFTAIENMSQKLSEANTKLADLNSNLENIVKERTNQLTKSNMRLQRAYDELRRLESSRRHLLSNLSHDLRTPIALILGYCEAILEKVAEGEKRDNFLRQIHIKAQNLERLIQDLFFLSQLEARELPFDCKPIRVEKLFERVRTQFASDVQHAGLRFHVFHVGTSQRAVVYVDLRRIEQVFSNLIYNAIRHTPSGGEIQISSEIIPSPALQPAIAESAAAEDIEDKKADDEKAIVYEEVLIRVKDTGSGIPHEDLPFIFDRLYKVKHKRNQFEGSGLGLAICKEIVEAHGGRIWAESIPGQGSTFCFTFPVHPADGCPSDK